MTQKFNFQPPDTDAPKNQKSVQILEAALSLFTENGVRKTSIDDIAEKAGIGRATVYRKFKDKDELIQAAILMEISRNLKIIEEHVKDFVSPVDAMIEGFIYAVHLVHKNSLAQRLFDGEADYILPFLTFRLGPAMAFARNHAAEQIREAQRLGEMSDLPADTTAEMLLRMMQSLILSPNGVIDPKDKDSLRRYAMNYLRPMLMPRISQ